jgi:hypothetical protein
MKNKIKLFKKIKNCIYKFKNKIWNFYYNKINNKFIFKNLIEKFNSKKINKK